MDRDFFKPENHPYTENPIYTGPGCAVCGRPLEEHPQGKAGVSANRAVRRMLNQEEG